jgi:PII-like signaling protein
MSPPEASLRLGIHVNASESWHGKPVYRAAVEAARARHMAGAAVFPVDLSYGAHRQVHDAASEYTSFDIPVVVELVDAPERVNSFLDELGPMVGEGLIHVRPVRVHRPDGAPAVGQRRPVPEQGDATGPRDRVTATRSATPMRIEGEARRVTVYVGSSDAWHGRNLAVAIVERCRELGMAGATASRGIMGFGGNSVIHRAHLLGLSEDLPEKIEVIDRPEPIERLLPVLDEMVHGGLIVVEDVRVIRYLREPKAE